MTLPAHRKSNNPTKKEKGGDELVKKTFHKGQPESRILISYREDAKQKKGQSKEEKKLSMGTVEESGIKGGQVKWPRTKKSLQYDRMGGKRGKSGGKPTIRLSIGTPGTNKEIEGERKGKGRGEATEKPSGLKRLEEGRKDVHSALCVGALGVRNRYGTRNIAFYPWVIISYNVVRGEGKKCARNIAT